MKKFFTLFALLLATWIAAGATNILGTPQASTDRMYQFVKSKNPGWSFSYEIAQQYHDQGVKWGIRGDIALCQACVETGWFRYSGGTAVTPDDHNYCGLGVTTLGQKGCQFSSISEGVSAHLQHLWAYATTAALPSGWTLVDPRFKYVNRGCAGTFENLGNGHWAVASGYGSSIMSIYNDMMNFSMANPKITASETEFTVTATQNETSPVKAVKITGENLSTAIGVVANASILKYEKASGWNDFSGGTLNISVDTSKAPGSYSGGYVRVYSGTTEVRINITVVINAGTTVDPDPDTPTDAGVYVDPASLEFSVVKDAAVTPRTVKVTGIDLTADIAVNSNSRYVIVTKGDDWDARKGGTLSITIDSSRDAGTYTGAYVAVQSTSTYRKQIAVDYTITAGGDPDPGPSYSLDDDAKGMTTVWESSQNASTKAWHELSSGGIPARDIAYMDGKLYVLSSKAFANPAVTVVDAYTGNKKADLNVTTLAGKAGVVNRGGAIACLDGKLIAVTVTDTPSGSVARNFYIYKWDSDSATPEQIYTYEGQQLLDKAFGHSVSTSGTWTSGRIWITTQGSNEVVYFPVNNGKVEAPQTLTLKKADGSALANAGDGRGTGRVVDNGDNTFWFNSTWAAPVLYRYDGTQVTAMKAAAFGANTFGTGLAVQKFGKRTYLGSVIYLDARTKSRFALYDITDGADKTDAAKVILSTSPDGFGSTANDQIISTALLANDRQDGNILDAWACVPYQGIAHYSYNGWKKVGVEDIASDETSPEAPVEFYNLQGVRMNGDSLAPGIYIRRQGNKTSKVLVR